MGAKKACLLFDWVRQNCQRLTRKTLMENNNKTFAIEEGLKATLTYFQPGDTHCPNMPLTFHADAEINTSVPGSVLGIYDPCRARLEFQGDNLFPLATSGRNIQATDAMYRRFGLTHFNMETLFYSGILPVVEGRRTRIYLFSCKALALASALPHFMNYEEPNAMRLITNMQYQNKSASRRRTPPRANVTRKRRLESMPRLRRASPTKPRSKRRRGSPSTKKQSSARMNVEKPASKRRRRSLSTKKRSSKKMNVETSDSVKMNVEK